MVKNNLKSLLIHVAISIISMFIFMIFNMAQVKWASEEAARSHHYNMMFVAVITIVVAVIIALRQVLNENGTLIMPAHSGEISDPAEWENPPVPNEWLQPIYDSMPAFDVNLTQTRGMGSVAELFRTLPEVYRYNHPQVSFASQGKFAKDITNNHKLTPQFGMESPLGKMYNLKAKVLLLGVGYDSCTCFHLAEALNKKMPTTKMGAAIIENNKRTWKWFEDFDYNSDDDFKKLGKALQATDNVILGNVGKAQCKLFPMKIGVDFAKQWLQSNRFN